MGEFFRLYITEAGHIVAQLCLEVIGAQEGQRLAERAFTDIAQDTDDMREKLEDADKTLLGAITDAGFDTPVEGYVEAGWNWAANSIKRLARQRDEALNPVTVPAAPKET